MDEKQGPSIWCLQEINMENKDTSSLKVRGWRTIYHSNEHQKKAKVATLILDKLHFKTKTVIRGEGGN